MPQRLPTVGGDNGNWGQILNDYLSVEHNSDGSLKIRSEGIPATIADGSITASKLSTTVNNYLASAQTAVQTVNGKTGTSVTLTASDVSAVSTSVVGAASGIATLDGTTKLTAAQLPTSVPNKDRLTFNVLDYIVSEGINLDNALAGTVGCATAVQAAHNAAKAAGGGDVIFPRPGRYLLQQTGTNAGQNWAVACDGDDVRFVFVDGAIVTTADDCAPFFFSGSIKPAGAANWDDYWLGRASNSTYRSISNVTAGDMQLTFTTASQAGEFSKGDYIYLRTGNVTSLSPNTEPQAEILRAAANGDTGTGVVLLEWACKHSYQQEYFISGTTGKTSTSVTANPAVFGAANVNDRIVRNVGLVNYQIDAPAARYGFMAWGVDGIEVLGYRGTLGGSPMNAIEWRNGVFRDFDLTIDNVASASSRWLITTATGCTTGRFYNIRGRAIGGRAMVAHFHEAATDMLVRDIDIETVAGDDGANLTPISIRGRATVDINGCRIVSKGSATPVFVSDECVLGGELRRVQASCSDATKGVSINAPGWIIEATSDTPIAQQGTARAPGVPFQVEALVGVLRHDTPSIELGVLPANAVVLWQAMTLDVQVAFTDTGTDRVTIGYDGGENTFLVSAAALDLGTTGRKDITTSHLSSLTGRLNQTKRDPLKAYYTGQNGDAGAGKAVIVVPYVRMPGLS